MLAKEHNLKRIAFSAISTGIYGYPIEKATKIALETVLSFIKENPEYEITFVLYNEEYFKEYIKQIKDYKIEYITEKLDIKKNGFASLSESIKRFKHNFHF